MAKMTDVEYAKARADAKAEWAELKEKSREYSALPYAAKVCLARSRIWEWLETCRANDKTACVSVGGLDSITLLYLIRDELGESADEVPAVSVSALEDVSIQRIHKQIGVIPIKPKLGMGTILQRYGFPIYSKQIAAKIESLQIPQAEADERKTYYNHALMTGETGPWGHFKYSDEMRMEDRFLEKFGGEWADRRPDLNCQKAPFKVSAQCCSWMKELPAKEWQEEHDAWPFLGLMQCEGGQRRFSLIKYGCNYVGPGTARSCPLNYFSRQDLLQLALDLNVPVPEIYGEIVYGDDGKLRTTKAQRTGCVMCGFGIHLDKRPHHFDLLRDRDEKQWEYWMYRCCTGEDGQKYGWGRVLDYIGVKWENRFDTDFAGQASLFSAADMEETK